MAKNPETEDYMIFSFHEEVRDAIADILEESHGKMQKKKLEEKIKEIKHYPIVGRKITYQEVQSDPVLRKRSETLFKYRKGVVYLN